MIMLKKTINGISLQKTIGRNYHRWTAKIAEKSIVFEAKLGRRSKKPIFWQAFYMPKAGSTEVIGEAASLTMCANEVIANLSANQE